MILPEGTKGLTSLVQRPLLESTSELPWWMSQRSGVLGGRLRSADTVHPTPRRRVYRVRAYQPVPLPLEGEDKADWTPFAGRAVIAEGKMGVLTKVRVTVYICTHTHTHTHTRTLPSNPGPGPRASLSGTPESCLDAAPERPSDAEASEETSEETVLKPCRACLTSHMSRAPRASLL